MGGFGSAVGKITGGLMGGLTGGGIEGESEGTQQMANYGLVAGDLVALLPINDGSQYIVLGKLIYAADFDGSSAKTSGSTADTIATAASLIGGGT